MMPPWKVGTLSSLRGFLTEMKVHFFNRCFPMQGVNILTS